MKITAALIALTALLTPSTVVLGREALLESDETSGTRRLGFWKKDQDYYKSIWYRCCNTEKGEAGDESKNNPDWRRDDYAENGIGENEYCNCPVRGSNKKGWWSSKTYFQKWTAKCADDGYIARMAGISD